MEGEEGVRKIRCENNKNGVRITNPLKGLKKPSKPTKL